MDKVIYQSGRLYLWDEKVKKYRWVYDPKVAIKVWGRDWEKQPRKYASEIENYPEVSVGKDITDWPENNEPKPNGTGHKTDKLYKLLYVCPWYSNTTGFGGLDQIKEVGFNTYHSWSPFQWEQEGWWTGEARKGNLQQVKDILEALKARDMYGLLQMPLQDKNLKPMAKLMAEFDNAIAGTVEEPDLNVPPSPTLAQQKEIYDKIKDVAPNLPVWGCFDGGVSERTFNPLGFDVLITDSYAYSRSNGPVPGTKADRTHYAGDPWWKISTWIEESKFKQLHNSVPDDMPIINIQQGMWNTGEGHVLPNVQQEWDLYSREFGLNSVGFYPHGYAQGMGGVYVMTDNASESYGLRKQCEALMRKLDMGGR